MCVDICMLIFAAIFSLLTYYFHNTNATLFVFLQIIDGSIMQNFPLHVIRKYN